MLNVRDKRCDDFLNRRLSLSRLRIVSYAFLYVNALNTILQDMMMRDFAQNRAHYSPVSFLYCIRSTMLVIINPCCFTNRFISGNRIISVGLSSETISHNIPADA
jgi:hypothetical protein